MLSAPSTADLADFTGTDVSEYSAFAGQALAQATLLFELASGLTEYLTDAAQYALAINGICEMADKIYSSQPYANDPLYGNLLFGLSSVHTSAGIYAP